MILSIEGPQLSFGFAGLKYLLWHLGTETSIELDTIWLRPKTSGFSRARLSMFSFNAPAPGDYRLRVTGLDPGKALSGHNIVFTRDRRAQSIPTLLALIAASLDLIGGIVLTIAVFIVTKPA